MGTRGISVSRWQPALCLHLAMGGSLLVAGCREKPATGDRGPVVAVTIFPIGDLARVLAGSTAEVVVTLPPGASPATFEPAPELFAV